MTLPERLAHLPDNKRRELERVARVLFDEFEDAQKTRLSDKDRKGRILKLILFGSYARGDWVEDRKRGRFRLRAESYVKGFNFDFGSVADDLIAL